MYTIRSLQSKDNPSVGRVLPSNDTSTMGGGFTPNVLPVGELGVRKTIILRLWNASQVWELHGKQGCNLNIKISQYDNTSLASWRFRNHCDIKSEDLKNQRSLNSDSTCHNMRKRKVCYYSISVCILFYFCLSPTVTPFLFHDIVKNKPLLLQI